MTRSSLGWFARGLLDVMVTLVPMMGFQNSAPGFQPTDNIAAWRRWSGDPLLIRHTRVDAKTIVEPTHDADWPISPLARCRRRANERDDRSRSR